MSAPHLAGHSVIHLVRDPVLTVASIAAFGTLLQPPNPFLSPGNAWGRWVYSFVETWDPWEFWLRWNVLISRHAQATVHLERLAAGRPPLNASVEVPALVPVPDHLHDEVVRAAASYGYILDSYSVECFPS